MSNDNQRLATQSSNYSSELEDYRNTIRKEINEKNQSIEELQKELDNHKTEAESTINLKDGEISKLRTDINKYKDEISKLLKKIDESKKEEKPKENIALQV